jgi:hypothetical protein
VTSWAEIVAQEERDASYNSVTVDVPEQRPIQHVAVEEEVGKDNEAHMALENDNRQEGEGRPRDREQRGPAKKKMHGEQQGRTDSTQPKQEEKNTQRIEGRSSNNNGNRHNITKTTQECAPGASTETEERESGDETEEKGTWFSLSTIEKIGDEGARVQPTRLKRTKKQTTKKRRVSAQDRSRSRVRNAFKST